MGTWSQRAAEGNLDFKMFPTPVASEGIKASNRQNVEQKSKTGQVWLTNVAQTIREENEALLPTPNTMDHLPPRSAEKIAESKKRTPGGYSNVRETVVNESQNWGQYEPAIRRWELATGRPAPAPTEPTGKNGSHQLSPKFTEWMMGLAEGHITSPEIGLSRNDALKACGNGVVPQQALLALQYLLREES